MPNSKRLGNFTEKSEILGKNRNCNEKTSHYLIKANKKNMLKAYCSALSTLGLLSNLRREWSGRIATFEVILERGRERFSTRNLTIQRSTLGATFLIFETNLCMACIYQ